MYDRRAAGVRIGQHIIPDSGEVSRAARIETESAGDHGRKLPAGIYDAVLLLLLHADAADGQPRVRAAQSLIFSRYIRHVRHAISAPDK